MILRRSHGYVLCYIARVHKIPLPVILDSEVVLASELAGTDATAYNFCSRTVNVENYVLSALKVMCERHDISTNFDKFITTNNLDKLQIEHTYKRMTETYKDGKMPVSIIESPTCRSILGSDYATKTKFRDYGT